MNIYELLRDYIQRWNVPTRFGLNKLHELFTNERRTANVKAKILRCAASEGLALYSLIAQWIVDIAQPDGYCPLECTAFFYHCVILLIALSDSVRLVWLLLNF